MTKSKSDGKSPNPNKRVAPRDKEENRTYTAEELDGFREARAREAELYQNPDPQTGFDITMRAFSAALGKHEVTGNDEIHLTAAFTGGVLRPGIVATAKGETVTIRIPCKITKGGDA